MDDNQELDTLKTLFESFEKCNGTAIPKNIKKTLDMMEYSSFMISRADSDVFIKEIEETIQVVLPTIIDDADKEVYFGKLYQNCPEKFKFFDGQKALIRDLIRYAFLQEKEKKKTESTRKRKRQGTTDADEVEKCKALVEKWFQTKLNMEIKCAIKTSKITDKEIQVIVECPLCPSKYKCHKTKNNIDQGWFLSNLYRHVNSVHIEKNEEKKDVCASKAPQPIFKFFRSLNRTEELSSRDKVVAKQLAEEIHIISDEKLSGPSHSKVQKNDGNL